MNIKEKHIKGLEDRLNDDEDLVKYFTRTKDIKNKRKNDYFQPELKTNRGNGST